MKELVPSNRSDEPVCRGENQVWRVESNPFWAFDREVSRFFDEAFHGFLRGLDMTPFQI